MKAYVQLMGGKHRVVIVAPAGQKISLQPAYASKASAEQAIKTWGFDLAPSEPAVLKLSAGPMKVIDIKRRGQDDE